MRSIVVDDDGTDGQPGFRHVSIDLAVRGDVSDVIAALRARSEVRSARRRTGREAG